MGKWSINRILAYERPVSTPMKITLPKLRCLERPLEDEPEPPQTTRTTPDQALASLSSTSP
jgi:hypothetical protein